MSKQGGLLITCEDTAQFAIETGLAPGVSIAPAGEARVVGSVLNTVFVARDNPVANGYETNRSRDQRQRNGLQHQQHHGPPGRPRADGSLRREADRAAARWKKTTSRRAARSPRPSRSQKQQPWEARKLNEEQTRNNPNVIPPQYRPDVLLRFTDAKTMLLSGLLDKSSSIAEHAVVVDAHLGKGNVLLFGNNPIYRGETIGTYGLVFNAILNYDRLGHEATPEPKQ